MRKNKAKPTILILMGYYLPGYKAGGPIRTISNMVEHLHGYYNFKIITRDRDLGDLKAYPEVRIDEWTIGNNCMIYYVSPPKVNFKNITELIYKTSHDVLYLNSFFDLTFSIKPLMAIKFASIGKKRIILAPRGEFSKEALNIKKWPKSIYLNIIKFINIYSSVIFHASSEYEKDDIKRIKTFRDSKFIVALDLPTLFKAPNPDNDSILRNGDSRILKIIFLSRISPIKNLNFCLEILKKTTREIFFDIYGPIEDSTYWKRILDLVEQLPDNVKCKYKGSLNPEEVPSVLSIYDLFFLPSKGENFGHVIAESLSQGTPVLISDNTPWKQLESEGLGWNLPLTEERKFVDTIERFIPHSLANRKKLKFKMRARFLESNLLEENIKIFQTD